MGINQKANGYYQYRALDHEHGEKGYGAQSGFDYYNQGPVYGYDYAHLNHHSQSSNGDHGHYHADHHHSDSQLQGEHAEEHGYNHSHDHQGVYSYQNHHW